MSKKKTRAQSLKITVTALNSPLPIAKKHLLRQRLAEKLCLRVRFSVSCNIVNKRKAKTQKFVQKKGKGKMPVSFDTSLVSCISVAAIASL
jgi:hypothetical protein